MTTTMTSTTTTATTTLTAKPSALLTLPAEIIDDINSNLPYTSIIALSWTCWQLHNKVDTRDIRWTSSSRLESNIDLLILEKWPRFARHFACCHCHRILRQSCFTLRQTHLWGKDRHQLGYLLLLQKKLRERANSGKADILVTRTRRSFGNANEAGGQVAPEIAGRVCIDCGIKDGRYGKGELLHFPLDSEEVGERPSSSSSDDEHAHGTGIVCKKCGVFKECEEDSEAAERRWCWDCLSTTPRSELPWLKLV